MANSSSSSKCGYTLVFVDGIGDIEIRPSKRAKHLKLAISGRSGIYVVKPRGVSENTLRRFVSANEAWIKKRLSQMPDKLSLEENQQFSHTKKLRVIISPTVSSVSAQETAKDLVLSLPAGIGLHDKVTQDVLMEHAVSIWRREAKIYLPKRLTMQSEKHGLGYGEVRVKYMHTRWGSCSSRNNINLNIQLMRLKPELIDYVLLHELVHTKEHNHSKAFWALFESLDPDVRSTSKILKSHQLF